MYIIWLYISCVAETRPRLLKHLRVYLCIQI